MQLKEKESINVIKYSNHEINNFKNGKVVVALNEKIIDKFVEDSIKYSSNKKLYFGKINKELANRIKDNIGINLNEYNISLQSNAIRHILKNHSNEKIECSRGQVAIKIDDFKLIPEIILSFDLIKYVGLTEYQNSAFILQKKIGHFYYLVSYISNKNHNLEIKTMWKIKAKKKNSAAVSDI